VIQNVVVNGNKRGGVCIKRRRERRALSFVIRLEAREIPQNKALYRRIWGARKNIARMLGPLSKGRKVGK